MRENTAMRGWCLSADGRRAGWQGELCFEAYCQTVTSLVQLTHALSLPRLHRFPESCHVLCCAGWRHARAPSGERHFGTCPRGSASDDRTRHSTMEQCQCQLPETRKIPIFWMGWMRDVGWRHSRKRCMIFPRSRFQ